MRIGIDTAPLHQHPARGAGALGRSLLAALLRSGAPHTFALFGFAGPETPQAPGAERILRPPVPAGLGPARLADALRLDRQLRAAAPDVFHALFQWNLPLRRLPMPVVGHVLDLMPLAAGGLYTRRHGLRVGWKIALYRRYLAHALRRVDRVIAISGHTRDDLVRLMGYPRERVHVVPPAPGTGMGPPDAGAAASLRERMGLPEGYLLYVGGYDFRKNVEVLLGAHARARRAGLALPLLLAGGTESAYGRRVAAMAGAAGGDVRLLGHVADADLPLLYGGARLVLYPSLYEGFGLPVLDALACGAPVACANAASLPEAGGEAALLLPPDDAGAWAEAMRRAEGDAAWREDRRRAGLAHAGRFSWEKAARETLRVYEAAAGGG